MELHNLFALAINSPPSGTLEGACGANTDFVDDCRLQAKVLVPMLSANDLAGEGQQSHCLLFISQLGVLTERIIPTTRKLSLIVRGLVMHSLRELKIDPSLLELKWQAR